MPQKKKSQYIIAMCHEYHQVDKHVAQAKKGNAALAAL